MFKTRFSEISYWQEINLLYQKGKELEGIMSLLDLRSYPCGSVMEMPENECYHKTFTWSKPKS